jgi:hypothetical protein
MEVPADGATMSDLSMCGDITCPSRGSCHRYCAMPDPERQTYAGFLRDPEAQACDDFMVWKPGDRQLTEVEK